MQATFIIYNSRFIVYYVEPIMKFLGKKVKDELSSYALITFSSIGSVLKTFPNQVYEIILSSID